MGGYPSRTERPNLLQGDSGSLAVEVSQFPEALVFEDEVVKVGHVPLELFVKVQPAPDDHQSAVDPNVHTGAFKRTRARQQLAGLRQWRGDDLTSGEIDDGSRSAVRAAAPYLVAVVPCKVRRFVGGLKQPRPEHALKPVCEVRYCCRAFPVSGRGQVFEARQRALSCERQSRSKQQCHPRRHADSVQEPVLRVKIVVTGG
jgi:hypothetical protein